MYFSYFTLIMWFPDLFERFEQYELLYPNTEAGICTVSEIVTKYEEARVFKDYCSKSLNDTVFIYTLIIGFSCVPSSVFLSVFIKKLGKKCLLGKTFFHHHGNDHKPNYILFVKCIKIELFSYNRIIFSGKFNI